MSATAALDQRRTLALIGALTLLAGAILLRVDGIRDGDLYLQLLSGRFISTHGLVSHDPFPTIAHGGAWLNQQWLSELAFFEVAAGIGLTGLAIAYAGLLAAPLALLLWICRERGAATLIGITALYCPGLWVVIHPRAAGFTVLSFSLLLLVVHRAWIAPGRDEHDRRLRWAVPAIAALFALWANLHGGFVAGLLLIGGAAAGSAIDRRRGLPGAPGSRRIWVLALCVPMAAAIITLATPLGPSIWHYLASFQNPGIVLASSEWAPAIQAGPAVAFLAVAAAVAVWLLAVQPPPRPLMPALVSAGFLVFGVIALRNIIFVAPALAFQAACSPRGSAVRPPRALIALALVAAAATIATWVTIGPARNARPLGSRLLAYVIAHPPRRGYIASYGGVSSYLLWRAPHTRVVLDGWLEHFSPFELRGAYTILDSGRPDAGRYLRALRVGAVVATRGRAVRALEKEGFVKRFSTRDGAYLLRKSAG